MGCHPYWLVGGYATKPCVHREGLTFSVRLPAVVAEAEAEIDATRRGCGRASIGARPIGASASRSGAHSGRSSGRTAGNPPSAWATATRGRSSGCSTGRPGARTPSATIAASRDHGAGRRERLCQEGDQVQRDRPAVPRDGRAGGKRPGRRALRVPGPEEACRDLAGRRTCATSGPTTRSAERSVGVPDSVPMPRMALLPCMDGAEVAPSAAFHPTRMEARFRTAASVGNGNRTLLLDAPPQGPQPLRQPRGGGDLVPPKVPSTATPVHIFHQFVALRDHSSPPATIDTGTHQAVLNQSHGGISMVVGTRSAGLIVAWV
jgi:hypothetical protein